MSEDFLPDDYVEVHERVQEFREDHPEGAIRTKIVKWEDNIGVFRATILDGDKMTLSEGTGHATREADSFVGEKFYEKGETVAVGRALAFAGYGIEKGLASKEEVKSAQASKQTSETLTDSQQETVYSIFSDKYSVSQELADYMVEARKDKYIEDLTKQEASDLISFIAEDETEKKARKWAKKMKKEFNE